MVQVVVKLQDLSVKEVSAPDAPENTENNFSVFENTITKCEISMAVQDIFFSLIMNYLKMYLSIICDYPIIPTSITYSHYLAANKIVIRFI